MPPRCACPPLEFSRLLWNVLMGFIVAGAHAGLAHMTRPSEPSIGHHSGEKDCLASEGLGGAAACFRHFLEAEMPIWDRENLGTLQKGVLQDAIEVSLSVRETYPWAVEAPWPIWRNWVLPYASVNEPRSSWRGLFRERLDSLLESAVMGKASLTQVVETVNRKVWTSLRPDKGIVFKSQQTPKVFDPMSTIVFGYASCSGISILLVDALRSVGVPARLVGTPAWNGNVTAGNHNWVEVWLGAEEGWAFMEGAPAGGGSLGDPCSKWFCSAANMEGTEVFAAQFDRWSNDTVYPMSWDLDNRQVPGVNRTRYYRRACGGCGVR